MALVAYGSSDSESDFEDEKQTPGEPPKLMDAAVSKLIDPFDRPHSDESRALKFVLPGPNRPSLEVEEDDEFLNKKPIAAEKPPPPPPIITKKTAGGTVKIMLPALSSFGEHKAKDKPIIGAELPTAKATGLLAMLPKPKSENMFGKPVAGGGPRMSASLVPDSIARPKKVEQSAPRKPISTKSGLPKPALVAANSDSDNSDDEDFFSLNVETQLPEVSASEISAMVANKSAQMNLAAKKRQQQFQSQDPADNIQPEVQSYVPPEPAASSSSSIDQDAMQALCGSRAKRGRNQEPMNIIDISGDQVMPDRDAWMRTQLTASTEYQPRGLVDQDPGAGTKRKHQITYLAHQAKANEAELQSMWAANRHTKRQTQNKYGF